MTFSSKVREQFPLLSLEQKGKSIVYLDNAATTQKPASVIQAIQNYYQFQNANIHRGVYRLSEAATQKFEATRKLIQVFIGAKSEDEIIFTKGTTESINLVASSLGHKILEPGDEILITHMEHHSNIVPWQLLAHRTGAQLRVAPINDRGELVISEFDRLVTSKTKIAAFTHASNAIGTINPVKELISKAKSVGAVTLVDGAQAVCHQKINVQDLGCDFYCFSGHKMYGPTGTGVLFGKSDILEKMDPYQGGGEMILTVTFEKTTFKQAPQKFEAGTPNISGVIGLGAAVEFLNQFEMSEIESYENQLSKFLETKLMDLDFIKIIGAAEKKASIVSFVMNGVHPHDIGTIVDSESVCIRTGHHCAQPIMDRFSVPATARASLALYNNEEDCERLIVSLKKVKKVFG